MKRILILNGERADAESFAVRNALEYFGYIVTMYNIGRPEDYFDVFAEKEKFDYDYLIIDCHGEDGKIIVPVLDEKIYYPHECRSNIGFAELQDKVKIKNKIIICTGCTTGGKELYKVFTLNNNIFIAPNDYIEARSALMFVFSLFYHLSNGLSLKESYTIASDIDRETGLFKMYFE